MRGVVMHATGDVRVEHRRELKIPTRTGRRSSSARASDCQREGGPIEVFRPGDRVFFEPGENHWHAAAPDRSIVHIAMQQHDESGTGWRAVIWSEHVSDEQYGAARAEG